MLALDITHTSTMEGKKRTRRSSNNRVGDTPPKMRKSCNACAQAKRKCDGALPCGLCMKRGSVCIYSERQKSGPKGSKGEDSGAGEVEADSTLGLQPQHHPVRASLDSSSVVSVKKRARKASVSTETTLAVSSSDGRQPDVPFMGSDVAATPSTAVASLPAPSIAAPSPCVPEETDKKVTTSKQPTQHYVETRMGVVASNNQSTVSSISNLRQLSRATPATPSPPRLPVQPVLHGSPVHLALPAPEAESIPSGATLPITTEAPPQANTSSRIESVIAIKRSACIPPSRRDCDLDLADARIRDDHGMLDLEAAMLRGRLEFSTDSPEAATAGDRENRMLEGSSSSKNADIGDRKSVPLVNNIHDDFEKGQQRGVVVEPQLAVVENRDARRRGLTPSLLSEQRRQEQQHQWVHSYHRSVSPSVVYGAEDMVLNRSRMMDVSPHGNSSAADRSVESRGGPMPGIPAHISNCATGTREVGDMMIISSDGGMTSGNHMSRSGSVGGSGVFSLMSVETAEAMSATLVEVMGGPFGKSNELLSFEDDMQQQQQHQHQHFHLAGGGTAQVCVGAEDSSSPRERMLWQHQPQQGANNPSVTTPAINTIGNATCSTGLHAGISSTTIPSIARPHHPVALGPHHHQQQVHNAIDSLSMIEPMNSLDGAVHFCGQPSQYRAHSVSAS